MKPFDNLLNKIQSKVLTIDDIAEILLGITGLLEKFKLEQLSNKEDTIKDVVNSLEKVYQEYNNLISNIDNLNLKDVTSNLKEQTQNQIQVYTEKTQKSLENLVSQISKLQSKDSNLEVFNYLDSEKFVYSMCNKLENKLDYKNLKGEKVRDLLENLQNDERLDVKSIKGLEESLSKKGMTRIMGQGGARVTKIIAGNNISLTSSRADGSGVVTLNSTGGSANIIVRDEAIQITPTVASLNFTGPGVTSTAIGNDVTINIPGGGGGSVPTGTGFRSVVAGIESPTAKLVDTADINANQVTNAKLAQVATATFKGRTTAGIGDSEDLTVTQAKTLLAYTKSDVGLGNVDNTADTAKPVSTAQQTALNLKANLTGATFTGAVTATNLSGTNTGDNATNTQYSGLVSNATHTGDVTGATTLTLATVNANVGSFGLAGSVAQFVVNAKGLITSAVNVAISITVSSITGLGVGVATSLGLNTGTANSIVVNGGALGIPSSATLTNATGLPLTGLVASTSLAIGVGSIELGNATDTTISRVSAGQIAVESIVVPTVSSINTLTNKRVQKRVVATTQSATPAINTDNGDIFEIVGLAQAITSMTSGLTGTPLEGEMVQFIFKDNGTARAITWGAGFVSSTVALPIITAANTSIAVLLQYRTSSVWTAASAWNCIAVA